MSDELTPEEREALKSLPRERMPSAGLEERVVGAMREHGFLGAKHGRVVRLTSSRVAGLVAACVVVIAGAYSIGLHRGGADDMIRGAVTEDELARSGNASAPPEDGAYRQRTFSPSAEKTMPLTMLKQPASKPEPRLEWKLNATEGRTDVARTGRAELAPATEAPQAGLMAQERATQKLGVSTRVMSSSEAVSDADAPAPPARGARARAYHLNGTAFIVEAPDSVRIVEDEAGRVLLIYTSDGVIRIRLAD